MPIIGAKGAESSGGFGQFAQSGAVNYIEDVFSTYLYTGNGSTQTITNNIDLSTKGGLVWIKERSATSSFPEHWLYDTQRGATYYLQSNSTIASNTSANTLTSFNTTGFSIGSNSRNNTSAATYVSWTFREQPKFFDVVTWTGDADPARTISHNLGSVPGCIIVKETSNVRDWVVYHTSTGNTQYLTLNSTSGAGTQTYWNNTSPTSTVFSVNGDWNAVNGSGRTYVAYLFASNAGGFGAAGTDNVITCGSYVGNGSATGPVVTLGYEPQWLLIKSAGPTGATGWQLTDIMRGMPVGATDALLFPNSDSVEVSVDDRVDPTATGFNITTTNTTHNRSGETYIYIAIRRGPMKTPTDATTVFSPTTATSEPTSTPLLTGGGFPSDMVLHRPRYTLTSYGFYNTGRLTGGGLSVLSTYNTGAASSYGSTYWNFDNSTAAYIPANGYFNNNGEGNIGYALYSFRRAPGFFDEVCYTGTNVAGLTFSHNLAAVPELMIIKVRNQSNSWQVYSATTGNGKALYLNQTAAASSGSDIYLWNNTSPTSTQFTLGQYANVNANGATYVAYLFATCAGVSKVGSYTGTGTLTTINCGFTGGARFVLIKRTDSTSDWFVWDTARGMVSGTDPSLSLNTTAAESNANSVYSIATGFQLLASPSADVNTNAATYIFLAIA